MPFYQINPIQTEKLYNLAIQNGELSKDKVIFDLYCGIGTIGIFMAKQAKQVYGVEIIGQAIEDAKENCKINNIENAQYYVGDTETVFEKLISAILKSKVRQSFSDFSIIIFPRFLPTTIYYIIH